MASFSVVSNIASANAQSNLQATNMGLNKALSRLSSGFRINTSGDDAAGLAVANAYRNDVAIMNQGIRNANDGLSKLQIKDSALANIATILDRMATLATQAASDVERRRHHQAVERVQHADLGNRPRGGGGRHDARAVELLGVRLERGDGVQRRRQRHRSVPSTTTALLASRSDDVHHRHGGADGVWRTIESAISTLGNVQNTVGTLQNRLTFAVSLAQSQVVNTTGRREPHPRRQHRGGVGEHDAVQHPEPERYRRLGAGERDELLGPRAAPVARKGE